MPCSSFERRQKSVLQCKALGLAHTCQVFSPPRPILLHCHGYSFLRKEYKEYELSRDSPEAYVFAHPAAAIFDFRDTYSPWRVRRLFTNSYVFLCAACSTLGGLLFRHDQGVVSIILVMPQFLDRLERVSEEASGAEFWKGLMTAMIDLTALFGAFNQAGLRIRSRGNI
ncbi:hypothetical protein CIHG_01255 [Coccidioides immitis H538.4]|uniref:ATINT1 protein n=3 Tax=Coccidioides immitis TaxID=5501 RepID=A0A0J8QK50_COCIT|nr:Hypothetical Protein CIRG_01105 [Coccidioides immitis RMSCC 2394]KMU72799.1 ATINT1 protein [Coccidioides immitis RMSCC 3703]KMU83473.1 hypothetical protein CIHG_01255 [Coccidioides immitis H538.4]